MGGPFFINTHMSEFTEELKIELQHAKKGIKFKLLEPLTWHVGHEDSPYTITIPRGFCADGITVPRPLWGVIPPVGHPAVRASVLHDYLIKMFRSGFPHPLMMNRRAIDNEFFEALIACGLNRTWAYIMYLGVRAVAIVKGEK